jgi:hypothetical protein
MVETILGQRHPDVGFRACMGIVRLAKTYSEERLEAACARAVHCRAFHYPSVKSILDNDLDRAPLPIRGKSKPAAQHGNIRGAGYFDESNNNQ